eukprot:1161786-Pelagomonas_calceolata.AAC.2
MGMIFGCDMCIVLMHHHLWHHSTSFTHPSLSYIMNSCRGDGISTPVCEQGRSHVTKAEQMLQTCMRAWTCSFRQS